MGSRCALACALLLLPSCGSTPGQNRPPDALAGGGDARVGPGDAAVYPDANASPDDAECANIDVMVAPLVPTVTLLIDQSGSMSDDFMGTTKWESVRQALTGMPNGVVTTLEGRVIFGAAIYTTHRNVMTCPAIAEVAPALNNRAAIDNLLFANSPDGDTPTGEALKAAAGKLKAAAAKGPAVIVLATDGEPDTCAIPSPKDIIQLNAVRKVAVDAASEALAAGIKTYVLSVGSGIAVEHLQQLANAGVGAYGAPYYVASSPAQMVTAFNTIIRGTRSCVFTVKGQIAVKSASTGRVWLNGNPLTYGDADGWTLVDPSKIEIKGQACKTFLESDKATVTASFPCDAVTIS